MVAQTQGVALGWHVGGPLALNREGRNQATASDAATVARIERDIDEIIYRLFDLTAAEIAQIETALANTRGQSSDDDDSGDE